MRLCNIKYKYLTHLTFLLEPFKFVKLSFFSWYITHFLFYGRWHKYSYNIGDHPRHIYIIVTVTTRIATTTTTVESRNGDNSDGSGNDSARGNKNNDKLSLILNFNLNYKFFLVIIQELLLKVINFYFIFWKFECSLKNLEIPSNFIYHKVFSNLINSYNINIKIQTAKL